MNAQILDNGADRISYDSENCYLTLLKGREANVLIGPDGLIEAGLNLCEVSNPNAEFYPGIYAHLDGVFSISAYLDGDDDIILTFTEGSRTLDFKARADVIAALGVALIRHGHDLNQDNEKRRYGGRVTFTKVAA